MKCERCGKAGAIDVEGEAILCDLCLAMVIREWKVKFDELNELSH